jgi:hypothetical protein
VHLSGTSKWIKMTKLKDRAIPVEMRINIDASSPLIVKAIVKLKQKNRPHASLKYHRFYKVTLYFLRGTWPNLHGEGVTPYQPRVQDKIQLLC